MRDRMLWTQLGVAVLLGGLLALLILTITNGGSP